MLESHRLMDLKPALILASNSPRRHHLLTLGGFKFQVIPAEVDETPLIGESPLDYVLRLAENKARNVAVRVASDVLVVAADTTVTDGEDILGKPADAKEASHMLQRLRGRRHCVVTALAFLRVEDEMLLVDYCMTDVPMRDYSDEEMLAYIASGDPLDKAGAYAIQHPEFRPVENLEGCYANVVGLPLCHLTRTLLKLSAQHLADVPQSCQSALGYQCTVYDAILRENI